jgi:3-methyl-2-oxobutanoate hydroxymethyltransferase
MKNIHDFYKKKEEKEKISMITCYDYTSACLVEKSEIDCVLVGDSVAMVMHGFPNTTSATMEMMISHTKAVARGLKSTFITADLPFMSYRRSLSETIEAVSALIQAGAQAVKLEGVLGNLETISYIVDSGVPVMGHIGLTPQFIHQLGGFKVQGKSADSEEILFSEAQKLQEAGCFSLVLECIPEDLAARITESLKIPVIGIGAGNRTDGQVLVYQDLLGLQSAFTPKFLKQFLDGEIEVVSAINRYVEEVKTIRYPEAVHCY